MITKRNIKNLILFIIVLIIVCLSTSCSTTKTFAQKEKELCTPNPAYHKIVWCDYDKVYIIENGKIKKIKNIDHKLYFVDDYLIEIY